MFVSLLKNIFSASGRHNAGTSAGRSRILTGKILNVLPGPHVDYLGHCADLSRFADDSILEIYASHVIEHLRFQKEPPAALREFNRVLTAGGVLRVIVPDLDTLCRLFLDPEMGLKQRMQIMGIMFGSQMDEADFHRVGLNEDILTAYLHDASFTDIVRVENFGLFDDTSNMVYKLPISLNVTARKPLPARRITAPDFSRAFRASPPARARPSRL